ncbi:hypothetical protein ATCV1_Z564L [Acanthocystis turfacea chlorella virus 1]|uniref:Uncharacterized protein Z564L n=1 Tax=Chlorovirus heliozoae TaxID=322019 RepID=A7K9H4_9PHYC|nr:hypothetical protein ATCV1_Z564L [Acanthocystis turfacea chlorella virus 1]ABT16698.1 hypothetical protein ATCV1_Z564L [Acanthocystis turfacea chlorella virus 1]
MTMCSLHTSKCTFVPLWMKFPQPCASRTGCENFRSVKYSAKVPFLPKVSYTNARTATACSPSATRV